MIAGIILAAGESSRMGRDKALLPYQGSTFLENILKALATAGISRVAVVLGHHAEEIQKALDLTETIIVINSDYQRGQTSSLQAGLRAIDRHDVESVLLCLVDHPAVRVETVRTLVNTYAASHAPVVIPMHDGRRGHPVLIGRELFEELDAIEPGQGANSVIRKYRERTQFVDVEDEGVLIDVDEPETFERLR